MESGGFEDDFAPLQSSNGTVKEDDSFILNDEESPKKNSEGNFSLFNYEITSFSSKYSLKMLEMI